MNELRKKIDDLLRESKAEIAGYDNSKVIPAILDAVIAAADKLDSDTLEVINILQAAKENK